MEDCQWVDDDIIELHAMGRIRDNFVREHLDCCPSCIARIAGARVWIDRLMRGLRSIQETSEHRQDANEDDSNRQDGS
jgi:hypothetical protein